MNDFNDEVQNNSTRCSLLSEGWHNASGSYRKGSESIPPKAWVSGLCHISSYKAARLSVLEFISRNYSISFFVFFWLVTGYCCLSLKTYGIDRGYQFLTNPMSYLGGHWQWKLCVLRSKPRIAEQNKKPHIAVRLVNTGSPTWTRTRDLRINSLRKHI